MLTIKVLGRGCANCRKLEELARTAAAGWGAEFQIEHVTDSAGIMRYDVLATPGLVVNEKLASAGRVPSVAEITTWLADAMMTAEAG
jgi:small redox-active disulfide protein 2